jgi:hypothetical protein
MAVGFAREGQWFCLCQKKAGNIVVVSKGLCVCDALNKTVMLGLLLRWEA